MLKRPPEAPLGAAEAAEAFARRGLAAFEQPGDYGVSRIALPVFTPPRTAGREDLRPGELVQSSWRFPVLKGQAVVAFVNVRERDGRPRASSMQLVDREKGLRAALATANRAAAMDGERQIRVIEMPTLHSSFLWVTGEPAVFIDRENARTYSENEFVAVVQSRWDVVHRPLAIPDPDQQDEPNQDEEPLDGFEI
jgi:hypothetical protein